MTDAEKRAREFCGVRAIVYEAGYFGQDLTAAFEACAGEASRQAEEDNIDAHADMERAQEALAALTAEVAGTAEALFDATERSRAGLAINLALTAERDGLLADKNSLVEVAGHAIVDGILHSDGCRKRCTGFCLHAKTQAILHALTDKEPTDG